MKRAAPEIFGKAFVENKRFWGKANAEKGAENGGGKSNAVADVI